MAETLEEDTERRSVARKSTYDPKTAASARRTVKGIRTKHHENRHGHESSCKNFLFGHVGIMTSIVTREIQPVKPDCQI